MNIKPFTNEELHAKIDIIPNEKGLIRRMRIHQAWWRLMILNEKAGKNPVATSENVCNTIIGGIFSGKNFLTSNTLQVVNATLAGRTAKDGGKIEINRLHNNLLSSQPLCFNFFAELEADKNLGLNILKCFWSDVTQLNRVIFEYSPTENYTGDGSAFDIAFDVQFGNQSGFIGLECKYTDTFSFKSKDSPVNYGDIGNKNHDTYFKVYTENKASFKGDYYDFVMNKDYNQLFRSQLMAEAMLQHKKFDVVKTGLFCYHEDQNGMRAGEGFTNMLADGKFKVITYANFIENVQKLNLTWQQREWTMMLWARYCGLKLSEEVFNQLSR